MGKIFIEKKNKSYRVNFGVINPETQHPFFRENKVAIRLFSLILMDFRITFSSFYLLLIFTSQETGVQTFKGSSLNAFPS